VTAVTGLEREAASGFPSLKGGRAGLVTHPAAVDRRYRSAAELVHAAPGVTLAALFGPEHGLAGTAQDLEGVAAGGAPFPGVRVYSLYGDSIESLRPTRDQLDGLDVLAIDLVDVGSRYYTFQATMLFCLEEAAKAGLRVVIFDRPNPLGDGAVEGPPLMPGFESFVGIHPVCTRHGMTVGELARLYVAERRIDVEYEVVRVEGWRRGDDFDATRLPWVMPSPNMPTVDTAFVYPGMCLIEGTNLSEGRGTTRPFELVGAPGVDAYRLAATLSGWGLPGVVFRPAAFKPTFQKHDGRECGGVQLHVTDRKAFRPVRTGLAVLAALREAVPGFAWRTETYEFVSDPIAIDLLFGSNRERLALEAGADWRDLAAAWGAEEAEFIRRRTPYLLY
jgi:uncharacterized protein YbbC (DUF1343 family)